MTIRIWQSFSCNNSSSYRLVARFETAAVARTAADDLEEMLQEYAGQFLGLAPHGEASPLQALARRYGFDWEDDGWGGRDDGPHVLVEGDTLIVHHAYCLGLGPGMPAFLAERGGKPGMESHADFQVCLLFRSVHGEDPLLDGELAKVAAQIVPDRGSRTLRPPWVSHDATGRVSMFRDAGTVGLCLPIAAPDLAALKAWLVKRGMEHASIRIEDPAEEQLYRMLAAARCTACAGALEYLDPRLHDIETPQLVCRPCGGFYEVSTFTSRVP